MSSNKSSARSLRSGWLKKRGAGAIPTWTNRFFVFSSDGDFSYYEDDQKRKHKGSINCNTVTQIKRTDPQSLTLVTAHRKWKLWAYVENEADAWEKILREFVRSHQNTARLAQHMSGIKISAAGSNAAAAAAKNNNNTGKPGPPPRRSSNEAIDMSRHPSMDSNSVIPAQNPYLNQPSPMDATISRHSSSAAAIVTAPPNPHYGFGPNDPSAPSAPPLLDTSVGRPSTEEKSSTEVISLHTRLPEIVSLKSCFGQYMSYVDRTQSVMSQPNKKVTANERWRIRCIDINRQLFSVQSVASNYYLSAQTNGNVGMVKNITGSFEHWHIECNDKAYKDKISLQCHFGGYLGSNNTYWSCHFVQITEKTLFGPSPPIMTSQAITTQTVAESTEKLMLTKIPWPVLGESISFQTFGGNSPNSGWIGIEKDALKCDFGVLGGWDGKPYSFQIFEVFRDKINHLYAFKAFGGNYLTPNPKTGKIEFSKTMGDNEYFRIIWHSTNVVSIQTIFDTFVNCANNQLWCSGKSYQSPNAIFKIAPKATAIIQRIPQPKMESRLRLKCNNGKYLTFRSKPDHFESTSLIMGKWETFNATIVKSDATVCIVNLLTANGRSIGCGTDGVLTFKPQNEGKTCEWRFYFHTKDMVSIQSVANKKLWLALNRGLWLMGKPIPHQYAFRYAQRFEMCPWISI